MPSYKLRNFKPVKTINGIQPDATGNVSISTGGAGGAAYSFKEEIFLTTSSKSFSLTAYPLSDVPLTVTVNGLVLTKDDYIVAGNTVSFPEGSVEINDIVRIMYAHGG